MAMRSALAAACTLLALSACRSTPDRSTSGPTQQLAEELADRG